MRKLIIALIFTSTILISCGEKDIPLSLVDKKQMNYLCDFKSNDPDYNNYYNVYKAYLEKQLEITAINTNTCKSKFKEVLMTIKGEIESVRENRTEILNITAYTKRHYGKPLHNNGKTYREMIQEK